MKTVQEFTVTGLQDRVSLPLPNNARPFSAFERQDNLIIAVVLDTTEYTDSTTFRLAKVGHPIEDDVFDRNFFLGTVTLPTGTYHVFVIG